MSKNSNLKKLINKDKNFLKKFPNIEQDFKTHLHNLFPLMRSLTGKGNLETLKFLKKKSNIKIKSFISRSKVYDWKIPDEWTVKEAYIADNNNKKLVNFRDNNLHLMSYSVAVNKILSWKSLKKKLHFDSKNRKSIPYRTSYYKKDWGFCVSKNQYDIISKSSKPLRVFIDSTFKKGEMYYGEKIIKGKFKKEILISTYICHPSMANDNLSGIIIASYIANYLSKIKNLKWTYRIIFIPETIGSISYLYYNKKQMQKIDIGINLSTCGGPGYFGYKMSWDNSNSLNQIIENLFKELKTKLIRYPFDINGSDERQYSSKGFKINIPVITKDKFYEYKEYHTSLDNLEFVKPNQLIETFYFMTKLIDKLEKRKIYKSNFIHGEIMLKKNNLFRSIGGEYLPLKSKYSYVDLILWAIFLMDGVKSIDDIALELKINKKVLLKIINLLIKKKIIKHID